MSLGSFKNEGLYGFYSKRVTVKALISRYPAHKVPLLVQPYYLFCVV